ncbi:MAG: YIP1 family protein [Burkholderiales bacterium]|jgi:hypothetical protein|nr:YIP1 family protein [Burkholderiales bacterium]
MNLIQRVQDILLKPKDTWPVIDEEASTVESIYKKYLVYLAAIPAVAIFIGLHVVERLPVGSTIVSGLVSQVISYVLSLAIVYGLALIANELAPKFDGTKNILKAFKLMAYGSTALFVGGIFFLVPALSMLSVLANLYCIYLIYTGVPVLMKCPDEKAVPYTATLFACAFVAGLVVSMVIGVPMMGRGMRMW